MSLHLSPSVQSNKARLITVTLVEADEVFRNRLSNHLARCPEIVIFDVCSDLATAEVCVSQRRPRVVLVGDGVGGAEGWQCIGRLRDPRSQTLSIALSNSDNLEHVRGAFRAGALGYLLRQSALPMIQQAIVEVIKGGSPMTPQVARVLVSAHAAPSRPSGLLRTLTRREQEVLQLLSLGQRYADIAERLSLSRNTVHSHAKKIYSKLLVKSKTEAGLVLGRNGNALPSADLPVWQRQVA